MALSSVLSFWVVAALLIAVPGPDWAFAISAGLRRQVVAAAAGIMAGYIAMTVVVAAGLGLLIASTSAALAALTLAGGGYLIWLGIGIMRDPVVVDAECDGVTSRSATLLRGMAVSGLNPKGLLIFVALLPQFSDPGAAWPVPIQLAVLGTAFVATCAVVYLCVAGAAQRLLDSRPVAARIVSRVSGASMVTLGGLLLFEHVVA